MDSKKLERQLARWTAAGLLEGGQADRILAHERTEAEASRSRRFTGILSVLGGGLVAFGVILLISYNWQALHRGIKLAGLFALMGGAYGGGYWLKERAGMPKLGEGLLLLGGLLFLAGIGLVSQIYHLNDRPPTGVLVWWAGIALLPYLMRSWPLAALSLAGASVWFTWETMTPDSWVYLGGHQVDPGLLYLALFAGAGAALLGAGALHRRAGFGEFGPLFEQLGLWVLLICGYLVGFARQSASGPPPAPAWMWAVPALAAGGLAFLWRECPAESPWHRNRFVGLLGALAVLCVAPLPVRALGADWLVAREIVSFTSWVVLFVLSLLLISTGLRWRRPAWINLGILFIGLNALGRFVDLFGDMLQTAYLFLLGGGALLAGGYYLERTRRRMMRRMEEAAV